MSTDLSVTTDFAAHIARLRTLPQNADPSLRTLFDRESPIHIARAPGRLDIMGGIGDYSGSLVLELPTAEAAFAAVQITNNPDITIATTRHDANASESQTRVKIISSTEWETLRADRYESARAHFAQDPSSAWAAYVAGPALVLLRETESNFTGGLRILIHSHVPQGKGVSSSAAVEVATMRAVAAALGIDLTGGALAHLCQQAENQVVGAPCGIMDQMTSALGRENELLALRCQPAIIEGFVPVPKEILLWGIDSGIRHAVTGADYASVRCGAFMGYSMIAHAAGLESMIIMDGSGTIIIEDERWHGYLANIAPSDFQQQFDTLIPEYISGADYRVRYYGTTDRATRIDPSRTYAVRAPTLHPIYENHRANRFRTLLHRPIADEALREMGQLMYASHDSYTACGLGSDGTDLLVNLVRESGPTTGLYGAKITGGGSGGAVAILGLSGADGAVAAIARRYSELTGREAYIFRGSSPGAYSTPVQQIVI
jgi:L-arabinokinase